MTHTHSLLVLTAAILLIGAGTICLALAWRRHHRGEPSGVVVVATSPGQAIRSIAVVPVVGVAGTIAVLAAIAALEGRLRLL